MLDKKKRIQNEKKQDAAILTFIKSISYLPNEISRSRDGRMINLEGFNQPVTYYDDPRVHNFGNNSWFHAVMAPLATKMIDIAAYDGVDLRSKILKDSVSRSDKVCDLCCGVGSSTVSWGTGVDTSSSFVNMARSKNILNINQKFIKGNAETFGKFNEFDVVTCMFATHEMPRAARLKVLANAKRIAKKKVIFVDLDPNYTPSDAMLSGEPYFLEYKRNIDLDFFGAYKREVLVKEHAVKWEFRA